MGNLKGIDNSLNKTCLEKLNGGSSTGMSLNENTKKARDTVFLLQIHAKIRGRATFLFGVLAGLASRQIAFPNGATIEVISDAESNCYWKHPRYLEEECWKTPTYQASRGWLLCLLDSFVRTLL
jgi:hypothetical protein